MKIMTRKRKYSKENLPVKMCPVCNRPFAWRKRWERVWESVVYCSERCRRLKSRVRKTAKVEALDEKAGLKNRKD